MTKYILIFMLFWVNFGYAQNDSLTRQRELDRKSSYYRTPYTTTKKALSLRAGLGYAKSIHTELGIARHLVRMGCVGAYGTAYYVSTEHHFTKADPNIYAFKTGANIDFFGLAFGMDIKYQTNFRKLNDVVITPKVGIGWGCIVQVFYGYHISTNDRPFKQISTHGVSAIFQLDLIGTRL